MIKVGYVVRRKAGILKGMYWSNLCRWTSFNKALVFDHIVPLTFDEELVEVRKTMAGRWKIMGVVKDE